MCIVYFRVTLQVDWEIPTQEQKEYLANSHPYDNIF